MYFLRTLLGHKMKSLSSTGLDMNLQGLGHEQNLSCTDKLTLEPFLRICYCIYVCTIVQGYAVSTVYDD